MDKKSFQRIAPRFLDGESPPSEERRIQQRLMSDVSAQGDIELLETEAQWISRAIAREAESDIARVIIRVRRRNPYRKRYVSPILSVGAQLVLVGVVVLVMSWLANSLTPVTAVTLDLSGQITLEDAGPVEVGDSVRGGERLVLPAETDQARLLFDASDIVRLRGISSFQVLPPTETRRRQLRVELGEAWLRTLSRHEPLLLYLGPSPQDAPHLNLVSAEVSVQVGAPAIDAVLPRGATREAGDLALVRVLEGQVTSSTDPTQPYGPRSTFLINRQGQIRSIADPDIEHYVALRLDAQGRFRNRWLGLNSRHFPFAREGLTFALWRTLAQASDRLDARLKEVRRRDGAGEIDRFRDQVNAIISGLEVVRDPQGTEEKPAAGFSAATDPYAADAELVAAAATQLATLDPAFLILLRPHIRQFLERWEDGQASLLTLYTAPDMTQVWKVLTNMAGTLGPRVERAYQLVGDVEASRLRLAEVAEQALKLQEDVALLRTNSFLDHDGAKRAAVTEEVRMLRQELEGLKALESQIELKRVALLPMEREFERAQRELARTTMALRDATEAVKKTKADLETLNFRVDEVSQAEQALRAASAAKESATEDVTVLATDLLRITEEAEQLSEKEAAARELWQTDSRKLEAAQAAIQLAEQTLAKASAEREAGQRQRDFAKQQLEALTEGEREGSIEEQALSEAEEILVYLTASAHKAEQRLVAAEEEGEAAKQAQKASAASLAEAQRAQEASRLILDQATAAAQRAQEALDAANQAITAAEAATRLADERRGEYERLQAAQSEQEPRLEHAQLAEQQARDAFAAAEKAVFPLRGELEALQKEVAKVPDLEGRIAGLNAEYRRIDGVERELTFALRDQFVGEEKAVQARHDLYLRLTNLDRLIAAEYFTPAEDIEGYRVEVGFSLEDVAQAWEAWSKEKNVETSGKLREVLATGNAACAAYAAAADTAMRELEASTADDFRRIRAQRLALAWLAAIASRHSQEAVRAEQERFQAFRIEREKMWGTSVDDPESLTAQMLQVWKNEGHQLSVEATDAEIRKLLGLGLRHFYWADPDQADVATGTTYLGLLRSGVRDERLRRPATAWLEALKQVLGPERLAQLAARESLGQ